MKVEGVLYELDWVAFKKGTSVFFPCLDGKRAKEEVSPVFKRLGVPVVMKVVIEEGVRGLRVWRV